MGIIKKISKKVVSEIVNQGRRSIQLEQKIIHLKSEVEKYKTMLASFQSDQQSNHLKEQMEQLTAENTQLKETCDHYKETISTQTHEINRLSAELEEVKKDNRLLHDEAQKLKNENFVLHKKIETNEEKIQSLLSSASTYKQRQTELEKEKEVIEEKMQSLEKKMASHHALLKNYLFLQSLLTSWIERIKIMEKDYDFLKKNSDKMFKDFEELKEGLFTQKQETEDLKEEVRSLEKKLYVIEKMLSELDKEQQKDMVVLQKQILHQHVEIESLLEKTSHFTNEIEKILNQMADLTERTEKKKEDLLNPEMNEMKEMLSQVIQLLTSQQKPFLAEEKRETISPPKANTISPANSFLKLQEFIDEKQQSIIVSPAKKKNQSHSQMSNIYPQKTSQIKHVQIENQPFQSSRPPLRHKSPGEDDDKLPNSIIPAVLYTTDSDDVADTYSFNDSDASIHAFIASTEEPPVMMEHHMENTECEPSMLPQEIAEAELHREITLTIGNVQNTTVTALDAFLHNDNSTGEEKADSVPIQAADDTQPYSYASHAVRTNESVFDRADEKYAESKKMAIVLFVQKKQKQ